MRSVLLIRNKLFGVRVTVTNFPDIILYTIPSAKLIPALHNVLFVKYDSPVSEIAPCLLLGYIM